MLARLTGAVVAVLWLTCTAIAQPADDDRYKSWGNRGTGFVAVREPRWGVGGGALASWYGPGFHGRRTASGERFDQNALTFAHRSLPFNSLVRFHHKGRSAVCRLNDRGPAKWTGRDYDLSRGCANAIGMKGVKRVGVGRI